MSKQESTAINELIDIARSGKRVADDDAHLDLFRPRPTMTPGLPPAPVVRTRTASGTQNELPAMPAAPSPTATLMGAPAPAVPVAKPGAMAFDVGQLSTPGMAIPASMRSTRAGLPPPPARPPTQPLPPLFGMRSRAEGTPAPERIRPPTPLSAPAMTPAAIAIAEQHAPETLPPESLQLDDTSNMVEKHAPETLDGPPLPPLPPATLAPPPPRPANPIATHPTVSMYPGQSSPVQPPVLPPEQLDGIDVRVDVADRSADEQGWFDPTSNVKKQDMFEPAAAAASVGALPSMPMPGAPNAFEQQWGTMQVGRNIRSTTPIYKRKWFVPAAIGSAVLLMFVVGAAAFSGEAPRHDAKAKTVATKDKGTQAAAKVESKDANAAVAQSAAAPANETPATPSAAAPSAPSASNAAVAAAAPAAASGAATPSNFVDVRFDSNPAGASVMLVDGGKTSFLGTAPVNASVDPTKRYDVVYTLAGHPTQVQHFDPSATHHITAALGGRGTATPHVAAAAPAPATFAAAPPAVASTPRPRPAQHAAAPAQHVAPAAASDDGDAAPGGPGTLMVASHPSCEILVDGKDTGKATPQKAISLPPGLHKVRLLNREANIDKTLTVSISAGVATKMLQNFAQ